MEDSRFRREEMGWGRYIWILHVERLRQNHRCFFSSLKVNSLSYSSQSLISSNLAMARCISSLFSLDLLQTLPRTGWLTSAQTYACIGADWQGKGMLQTGLLATYSSCSPPLESFVGRKLPELRGNVGTCSAGVPMLFCDGSVTGLGGRCWVGMAPLVRFREMVLLPSQSSLRRPLMLRSLGIQTCEFSALPRTSISFRFRSWFSSSSSSIQPTISRLRFFSFCRESLRLRLSLLCCDLTSTLGSCWTSGCL